MSNLTITLILLRAFHRAANLFLKDGVVKAIKILEQEQKISQRRGVTLSATAIAEH
jgi:hypothetical protein